MEPERVWPPTPDNLVGVPVWENVVAQQVVQASLGTLPEHTLAFGVVIDAMRVTLYFQLTEVTDADVVDMDDIQDELHMQTGHILELTRRVEVREQRLISDRGSPVWWLYLSRVADEGP